MNRGIFYWSLVKESSWNKIKQIVPKICSAAPILYFSTRGTAVQIWKAIGLLFRDDSFTKGQTPISVTCHWRILSYVRPKIVAKQPSFFIRTSGRFWDQNKQFEYYRLWQLQNYPCTNNLFANIEAKSSHLQGWLRVKMHFSAKLFVRCSPKLVKIYFVAPHLPPFLLWAGPLSQPIFLCAPVKYQERPIKTRN